MLYIVHNKHEITWLWGDSKLDLKVLTTCWESVKKALRNGLERCKKAQGRVEKTLGKVLKVLKKFKSFWTFSSHQLVCSNRQVTVRDLWPLFHYNWKSGLKFKVKNNFQTLILLKFPILYSSNEIFWKYCDKILQT